ncbi:Hypothetical predicted protein [Octopus vulgaris]|uniref:Helitron helicase-like domain-containing protein n=1 Tax=Octopus vulgaris TaxID=6645 RepID=A0AA36FE23_OCTVU|nr:Hypothetical predicted protein [Octopus vulgaris]
MFTLQNISFSRPPNGETRLAADRIQAQQRNRNQTAEQTQVTRSIARRKLKQNKAAKRDKFWYRAAFTYDPAKNYANNNKVTIGKMDKICSSCGAKKWDFDVPGLCCSQGKVRLPPLPDPPQSAWMYTVEWQKRGLPHVHMLAWCQDRIHPVDIDRIVSAELPDQNADPQLHSSVTKHMIHGPCGDFNPRSQCMKNKRCSKRYPRDYCGQTCTTNDGYPIYRRRDPGVGGRTARIRQRLKTFDVDNAWIVPFNPLLSKTFNAHINVEYCNSVRCIQYLCKYINKGDDMAVFVFSDEDLRHDEIKQFVLGRYVSSNYAAWRIFGYEIHLSSPSVFPLNVHLQKTQLIYFTEKNARQVIENPKGTTITAF